MRRSPASLEIPPLGTWCHADLLPIEYPNYEAILGGHELYDRYKKELESLHKRGFVVLENAVDAGLCDLMSEFYGKVADLSIENPPYAEYFDSAGNLYYGVRYDQDGKNKSNGKFKLVDLFAENDTARQVCFSEKISDLLSLAFNSSILAFQQLGFIYGTEQPLHQDTAYVRVSKPPMLAASWVALEDIEPDSGELEFLESSHRVNHLRFNSSTDKQCIQVEKDSNQSIWYDYHDDAAHSRFLGALDNLRSSFPVGRFHAKKGDALIWISYFIHGGSRISEEAKIKRTTRKSLVTHYCPYPKVHPIYFHDVVHMPPVRHSTNCYFSSKLYPICQLPEDFSGCEYLSLNPDVDDVGRFRSDPGIHFIDHGIAENRPFSRPNLY